MATDKNVKSETWGRRIIRVLKKFTFKIHKLIWKEEKEVFQVMFRYRARNVCKWKCYKSLRKIGVSFQSNSPTFNHLLLIFENCLFHLYLKYFNFKMKDQRTHLRMDLRALTFAFIFSSRVLMSLTR